MDAIKQKQQWSEEETSCFLAIWSSTEVQNKLEGASRTKPVLQQIQCEMAAAGYERNIEQISKKLKKLKEYRDQKRTSVEWPARCNGRLDSILGDRLACQVTGALNSATITLESMVDDSLQQSCTDPGKFYCFIVLFRLLPASYVFLSCLVRNSFVISGFGILLANVCLAKIVLSVI